MHYAPNFEMQPGDTSGIGEVDRAHLRVWAAVFRQGLQDWAAEQFKVLPYGKVGVNRGEPSSWFDSDSRSPGAFCWLCDLFEIHPDQARSMARLKMRELVRGVGQRF